jgi:hypothetical protein
MSNGMGMRPPSFFFEEPEVPEKPITLPERSSRRQGHKKVAQHCKKQVKFSDQLSTEKENSLEKMNVGYNLSLETNVPPQLASRSRENNPATDISQGSWVCASRTTSYYVQGQRGRVIEIDGSICQVHFEGYIAPVKVPSWTLQIMPESFSTDHYYSPRFGHGFALPPARN